MSGLKLVLPSAFTDTTMPILRDDPVLTAGSLMLIEANHPARPMGAGVANGLAVPNIAHKEASALLGGNYTVGQLDNTLTVGTLTGTKGKIERTGKGGIHGIASQAVALASGDGAWITLNPTLFPYIFNNRTHNFYLSRWDRLTRINGGNIGATGAHEGGIGGNNSTTAMWASMRADLWQGVAATAPTGQKVGANAVGARFSNIAGANAAGAANQLAGNAGVGGNAIAAGSWSGGGIWGAPTMSYNAAVVASRNLYWPSMVFYRLYVEDLTVSGRSYAEADAADYAEYTKQVLTAGGRYYADTFTDPATIA